MKRKTASRKKPAYKTKRNSRRRARTTRVKRGGMLNRRIMPSVREMIYHNILPLITAKQIIYRTGIEPKPSDYEITKDYERYYRTFADIPGDDGIKESIRNLRDELKDPVKNLGKIKDLYDAINKTLEEKRKHTLAVSKTPIDTTVNKVFRSSSPDMFSLSKPQSKSQDNTASPLTTMNKDFLSPLVKQPFDTPKRPDYSSSLKSPTRPFVKSMDDTYPDVSSRHLQSPGFHRRGLLFDVDDEDDDGDKDVKEDDDEDDEDDEDE